MPKGAVSRLASDSGSTPHITTAGRAWRGCPSTKAAPANAGSTSRASGRVDRLCAHHRMVLGCGRACEQLDDVEGDRLRARERRAPGEPVVEVDAVVEVGRGGQRKVLRAGVAHRRGKARPREEADAVTAFDEVPGDGQQRGDVPVDGHRGDEDGGHGGTLEGAHRDGDAACRSER